MKIVKAKDRDDVVKNLMVFIKNIASESLTKNKVFNVGLSGGSLGSFLTSGLLDSSLDFSNWKLFFCDERVVPEDDNDSTYGFYKKALIDTGKFTENQFFIIKQGASVEEIAADYEERLKKHFPEGMVPRFDLLLLGMGPDGHTCSLFPNHPLLKETERLIAPIKDSPKPPPQRITMTFKLINNAKNCIFAISGKEKAPMVRRILLDKEDLPAGRVNPMCGEVYWILDEGAASELDDSLNSFIFHMSE